MSCPLTELGILLSSLPQFYVSARELSAVRACARVRVDGCSRVGDGGRKRRGAFRNCLSPMNGYCSETVLSVRPSVRPRPCLRCGEYNTITHSRRRRRRGTPRRTGGRREEGNQEKSARHAPGPLTSSLHLSPVGRKESEGVKALSLNILTSELS